MKVLVKETNYWSIDIPTDSPDVAKEEAQEIYQTRGFEAFSDEGHDWVWEVSDSDADSEFEILYKVTSAICYEVEAPSKEEAIRLFKEEEDISAYTVDSIMDSPLDMDDIEIIGVDEVKTTS